MQGGRIFQTGTPRVAVERDFYKLSQLTQNDLQLLRAMIAKGSPSAKSMHENLFRLLLAPFRVADQVKSSPQRPMIEKQLDEYASNVLEDYHASIEASFIPLLEGALDGDISFYDDERCIPFLNYLCTQYMRTKGIKERSIALTRENGGSDLSRIWNILIHVFSTNIGAGLFLERKRRKLVLLRNHTDVPFITGDQPAINLKANGPEPPEDLSIYYPISPQLALVLGEVGEELPFTADDVTAAQAATLNRRLFVACHGQAFGKSKASLEEYR